MNIQECISNYYTINNQDTIDGKRQLYQPIYGHREYLSMNSEEDYKEKIDKLCEIISNY